MAINTQNTPGAWNIYQPSKDNVLEVKKEPIEKKKVLHLKLRNDTEKPTNNFLSRQKDRTKNNVDLAEILKIVEKKKPKPLG